MKAANLVVRFLLELCALGALAWWGAATGSTTIASVLLAVAAPLVAAVAWGVFVSPKARIKLPVVRWVVELAVFLCAAAGLVAIDHPRLALVLLAAYAVNRTLLLVLGEEVSWPAEGGATT